jgi:hypothetical protein
MEPVPNRASRPLPPITVTPAVEKFYRAYSGNKKPSKQVQALWDAVVSEHGGDADAAANHVVNYHESLPRYSRSKKWD